MKTCTRSKCTYPDCDCIVDKISPQRCALSWQYRLSLKKLLVQEIEKAAQSRGTTKKRIAAQLGITPQAFSRLMHMEGRGCSLDSLLMHLARLGVGVQIRFEDLPGLPAIDQDNPQNRLAG